MSESRELHLSEGRLRRCLARYLAPRVVEEAMQELVERPRDAYDLRVPSDRFEEIAAKLRRKGHVR